MGQRGVCLFYGRRFSCTYKMKAMIQQSKQGWCRREGILKVLEQARVRGPREQAGRAGVQGHSSFALQGRLRVQPIL